MGTPATVEGEGAVVKAGDKARKDANLPTVVISQRRVKAAAK
jgi:hypothetical protein